MAENIPIPSLKDLHIDIFDHADIRSLLNAYLDGCKRQDKRLSRRYFNETAFGKSTPGYLQSILNKKYKFADTTVERLIELLQTNNEQSEYLYLLTRLWDLETGVTLTATSMSRLKEWMRGPALIKLEALKGSSFPLPEDLIQAAKKALGSSWKEEHADWIRKVLVVEGRGTLLYRTLRQRYDKLREADISVVHLTTWGHLLIFRLLKLLVPQKIPASQLLDPQFIRSLLNPYLTLSPAEVAKCLQDLQTEGVVERQGEKVKLREGWRIADDFLWVKQYHRDVLEQASRSLDVDSSQREYQTIFLPTHPETLAEIKQFIEESKIRLRQAYRHEEGSQLMSISWQMFPVAEVNVPDAKEDS